MRRDSSYSSGGKTEDSLGRACVGPPRDDATAHRTWDHGRRSSSSSSSSSSSNTQEPSGEAATPAPGGGAVLFTPPQRCAVARRPETRPRLPRLWLCAAHNHRLCATCAAVGRGVRHCCATRNTGHPPPTDTARGAGQSEGGGAAHPKGGVGDPSAKRPKRRQQASVRGGQAFKRGRGHPDPPPPPPREAGTSGAA